MTMIACPGKTRSSDSQSPEYQSINAMQLVCQSIASTGICASMTLVGASRPPSDQGAYRSEEHTSELQSLMRISSAVFCLKKKKTTTSDDILHTSQKSD